jgi:hypothetical protein
MMPWQGPVHFDRLISYKPISSPARQKSFRRGGMILTESVRIKSFMNIHFLFFLLMGASQIFAQQKNSPQSGKSARLFVDPATDSDDPEVRMAYGLNVTPPWPDGGYIDS